jgi:hypothetical protein
MHSACHKINALICQGVFSEGGNFRGLRGLIWAKCPAAAWVKWGICPETSSFRLSLAQRAQTSVSEIACRECVRQRWIAKTRAEPFA